MNAVPGPAADWLRPDSTVSRMIAARAKRLSRSAGFCRSDFDDIAQELRLAIWRQQHRHDGKRTSFATFANRVMENHAISLVRRRRARKRGGGRSTVFLRHEPPDDMGTQLQRRVEMKADLGTALSSISSEVREVAELLNEHSLHSIGKRLHRSRRILHRQRRQLKRALEDASLRDYLPGADNRGPDLRK